MEVITALERLDGGPDDPAVRLLKTIGLLNLIGAQRGLKASRAILALLFGEILGGLLQRLEQASTIHFRQYSQEFRVWQGSDFDLRGALAEAVAEQHQRSLAETLNQLAPLKPIVARRATIETGTLRCLEPVFTSPERWPPQSSERAEPSLWFYLADDLNGPLALTGAPPGSVIAVCRFTERLRDAVTEWMALQELPKRHAELHHDPVAKREYRAWLAYAELTTHHIIRTLLEEPAALHWFFGDQSRPIRGRRHLQTQLSHWVMQRCYPYAPRLRNELINRDRPSPSANLGRKRLLAAMLAAADQPDLGIEKTPAEKSLYLSLLKQSGLHREENGRLGLYPPPANDPCHLWPLWRAIGDLLGDSGERQVPLPHLYHHLRQPPYGVRLGPLPVLIVAYLLAHPRDVALYQEGAFCEGLTLEQAELLCRRPELFALERFALGGLRGELFERYISSVVGQLAQDATLLDIARPLVRFIRGLPEYSLQCEGLSTHAAPVRKALQQAASPGLLLFDALPRACEIAPEQFATGDAAIIERFIDRLVAALRDLKQAYPTLLSDWQQAMNRRLLDQPAPDLAQLRATVTARYGGLDRYTPDRMGLGAFIRRLSDPAHGTDQAWLESVATLVGRMPPAKWRPETRRQAELRLHDLSEQLRDLEKLRLAQPDQGNLNGTLLLKRIDARGGEISHILQLTDEQRRVADAKAEQIAHTLASADQIEQLAVLAALLERFSGQSPTGEKRDA